MYIEKDGMKAYEYIQKTKECLDYLEERMRHKGTIKEVSYNRILTDRISDTGKRKLKHLKKFAGEGGYYLLEFFEEEEETK